MIEAGWPSPEALVALAVALPAIAAVVVTIAGGRGVATLGLVAAAPAVAVGLLAPPAGVVVDASWLLLGARFGVDAHTAPFALLTGTLWAAASVACAGYFDAAARRRIAPWWLLSLAGSVGLVLALDALSYFLFFALMSLASYGLVVHRADAEAYRAGRVYIAFVILGEVGLFLGLVLAATHPEVSAGLMLFGFGIKAGALVLHGWLPLAHAAAPAPASAVLSGAMLKAGLLGWLRFVDAGAPWAPEVGLALVALGLAGAYAGALAGIAQDRPKTVLAYSSVSQMGIVIAAFGMLLADAAPPETAAAACALFAVHHAFAKASLFIGVGAVERARGRARSACIAMMGVPALALIGLPLTSGALAKGGIKAMTGGLPEPWLEALAWALPGAAVGTSLLMLRLLDTLPPAHGQRCPPSLWLPVAALAAAGLALVAAAPGVEILPSPSSAGLAVAPLLAAIALRLLWRGLRRLGLAPITVPAGDIVVPLEALAAVLRRGARRLDREAAAAPREAPASRASVLSRAESALAAPGVGAAIALALLAVLGGALALGAL